MEYGPYALLMDFALMSVLLFIAQLVRANVRWVQNLFLPTAMIAGFMGLFLGESFLGYAAPGLADFAIPFSDQIASYAYMLVVVLFASLYIGNRGGQSPGAMMRQVGDTFTTNMAAEFGGFGVALLVGGGLLVIFAPQVSTTFAILQPAGFVGGHGYAAAISSGRTAGFAALDWSGVRDFTLLIYGGLMFIGGSTASVAGGIKVNTLAVLLAAARSAALRHPRTEIFRREIGETLVARALMIALIAVAYLGVVTPILTYTEPHLNFEKLIFETVSAFGTNGMSTGVSADLSLAGSIIFMVTMLAGRIGPLTLVMLLAPREEASYRYPQEPVRIG